MAEIVPDELTSSLSEFLETPPTTAEEIWAEFFPRLMKLAKKKIGDMPKRTFDEEDVALSAMNSFFRGREEGKFERLDSKDEIWRLLATITVRKATAQRRRRMATKRGGGQVTGESVFQIGDDKANPGLAGTPDHRLSPESTEEFLATCEELLQTLPDDKLRTTAIMRLEGFSNQEIADEMKCSVARTKQRLQRIRELWAGE